MQFSPSGALHNAIPAHQGRVMRFKETPGMPMVKVFPLHDHDDRYSYDRPCPEWRDKDKGRESHDIAPVVYPARTAAFAFRKPLKRTEHTYAELVHKDEEQDRDIDPCVAEYAYHAP